MFSEQEIVKHRELCEKTRKEVISRGFSGLWVTEPDRIQWKHAGLDCLMVRHPSSLHWCGYVGLPPKHPDHGKEYDRVDIDVHGGLTYSNVCSGFVCHKPNPGESDELYWLGFDCAHSGDESPGHLRREYPFNRASYETYKDAEYVRGETNNLAEQLLKRQS